MKEKHRDAMSIAKDQEGSTSAEGSLLRFFVETLEEIDKSLNPDKQSYLFPIIKVINRTLCGKYYYNKLYKKARKEIFARSLFSFYGAETFHYKILNKRLFLMLASSLFDIIDGLLVPPSSFSWSTCRVSEADYSETHKGFLLTASKNGKGYKKRAYILSAKGLIKCFVKFFKVKVRRMLERLKPSLPSTIRDFSGSKSQILACNFFYKLGGRVGFELVGCKTAHHFFCETTESYQKWINALKPFCVSTNISCNYSFGKVIGKGKYAEVYYASHLQTNVPYAIKAIDKTMILAKPSRLIALNNEIRILQSLTHPNICKLYEIYENRNYIHLVLEYLPDGSLLKNVEMKGEYPECEAKQVFKGLLDAMNYFHSKKVIHRDIKPENLVFDHNGALKVVDFGISTTLDTTEFHTAKCGSAGYMAPEVVNGQPYNTKADVYSAGVVLYNLLFSGRFGATKRDSVGNVIFPSLQWTLVTENAKDLVRKMIELDPKSRITAEEALKHPWIDTEGKKRIVAQSKPLAEEIKSPLTPSSLARFCGQRKDELQTTTTTPRCVCVLFMYFHKYRIRPFLLNQASTLLSPDFPSTRQIQWKMTMMQVRRIFKKIQQMKRSLQYGFKADSFLFRPSF
eukprot:TRINITY_DN149_c0_g1_i1.p1 TRINITY_DN149_c0_g1~~TRINITY_DN149_c0_g1_i1.p1  ORF type:complete len:625 (-),score=42.93 TRINITY_DN149_c0_g1_i1:6772-8646(-)